MNKYFFNPLNCNQLLVRLGWIKLKLAKVLLSRPTKAKQVRFLPSPPQPTTVDQVDQLLPDVDQGLPAYQAGGPAQDPDGQGSQLVEARQSQAHGPGQREQKVVPVLSEPGKLVREESDKVIQRPQRTRKKTNKF